MGNLSNMGRIFYGVGMTVMGLLTIYYHDFPYMLIPPKHSGIPGITAIAYIFGAFLVLAGVSIVIEKKIRPISLLLGTVLLLIFCFYFIPYQLFVSKNNMHFGDWENAAKELTLCGGAFVIAGCFLAKDESPLIKLLGKLIPYGSIIYALTIVSYGIDHFLYAVEAADYVPSWVPYHLFWMYIGGIGLFASGIAIIVNVKLRLAATLLGAMTFTWFVILHVPRVVVSSQLYLGSEITSAVLALAYSGIAFVIAGTAKK